MQSRYYCPTIGRFINADAIWILGIEQGNLLEFNLFTYCFNNPVNFVDPSGYMPGVATAVVGFIVAGATKLGPHISAAWNAVKTPVVNFWSNVVAPAKQQVITWASNTWDSAKASVINFGNNVSNWWSRLTGNTNVYRSVSSAEAANIRATGRFNLVPGGMEAKQFGFSLAETMHFGARFGQNIVVRARIPTSFLGGLDITRLDITRVDTTLFRSGTVTVPIGQLEAFNQVVGSIRTFVR
ncbi:MAG: hypothetical protein FWE28_03500 [Oscillospiraceae bacterium]|nr:hypothetical protein [Oscillospiraceae bacterium]